MICKQAFKQFTLVGLSFLIYTIVVVIWPNVVLAQGAGPFLSTPYYGTKSINSYYDHTSPLSQNQNVRYFDARLGTVANCDANFNRAYAITNGECLYYDGHEGIDFGTGYDAVLAAAMGTVSQRGWENPNNRNSGYGLFVDIQHIVSVSGQNVIYTTRYGHLSAVAVNVNQVVQAGQIIGSSGSTGNSTGAHLHFGVLNQANQNTDPFGWTGGGADPSGTGSTCLWVDGEWASYCGGVRRPIPAPVNNGETQINETTDNTGGFTKGNGGYPNNECPGNCTGWTYNSNMYYASSNGSTENRWARWLPGLPVSDAFYEVMVFVPNVAANTTTWTAPYTIQHANGTTTAIIDQEGSRNRWISIGTYRMQTGNSVYVTDASGETANTRRIGVDGVKFVRRGTVYAPDVRDLNVTPTSSVIIRNNGGGPATYIPKFMGDNGAIVCSPTPNTLAAHQTTSVSCGTPTNATVSAVIEGNQDLAVLVRSFASGVAMLDNAFVAGNTVDPAFEQTATTLYVPAIYNNIFSGLNSTVHIQNTTGNQNAVTLTYIPRPGYLCSPCTTNLTLSEYGKLNRAASTLVGNSASVGSLVISAAAPVAVKVEESQNGTISRSFNALAIGSAPTFVPAAYKAQFQLNTGLVIQNLHATASTNVILTYCERLGGGCVSEQLPNALNARRAVGVNLSNVTVLPPAPTPWSGSVQIDSSGSIPLGVAVTNSRTDFPGGYDFNGSNRGSRVVVLPRAVKNTNGITTGYTVRNVSTQAVTVVARYYQNNGTFTTSRTFTINVNGVEGFHQSNDDDLGTSWAGSVVLSATDNIIAIMREDTSSTVAGYNGIPR